MVRRFLLSSAILLIILVMVPACDKPHSGAKPTLKDEPPPEPKPAGKSG
ncbi:MAG TPA: hypothetical protein VKE74_26030 [Gemmataceae bacterium]|nr:hypothetical protein [Gemmataceae bacterium]